MALSEKNRFKKLKPNKDENRYATELSSSIPHSYAKRARFAKKCLKNFWQKERHFRLATMRKLWSIFFCRMQVISKKLIHPARVNCLLVLLASFGTVFVLFQG